MQRANLCARVGRLEAMHSPQRGLLIVFLDDPGEDRETALARALADRKAANPGGAAEPDRVMFMSWRAGWQHELAG